MEKAKYSGQGSSEYPCRNYKISQGIITHMPHIFREKDPIIPDFESKDILHGGQSLSKLYSLRNNKGFQVVIQALPTLWLPHRHIACRWRVWAF